MTKEICKLCNSDKIEKIFEVEDYPVIVGVVQKEDADKILKMKISIGQCLNCGFVMQIGLLSDEELKMIYDNFYSFPSPALSGIGTKAAQDFRAFIYENSNLKKGKVLEIGCFDGYFLSLLKNDGFEVYGCEPSGGADIAISEFNIPVEKEYYRDGIYDEKFFDMVAMRHLLEHIEEPVKFLKSVYRIINDSGYLSVEVPDIKSSMKNGVIGNFSHQHVSYFSSTSLNNILELVGFEVIKMEENFWQILCIAKKKGNEFEKKLSKINRREVENISQFAKKYKMKLERIKKQFEPLISEWEIRGEKVSIFGAGGHTTDLIKLLNLDDCLIKNVFDNDKGKIDKVLSGFNIVVKSPDYIRKSNVDVIIISSYIYQVEIIESLKW